MKSPSGSPFSRSRSPLGGPGGISFPGLISLWNARNPIVSARGPQIQTSVAGLQPDASGNMVQWPVNHPGRGVICQPAYSNLLAAGSEDIRTWTILAGSAVSAPDANGWYKITTISTINRLITKTFSCSPGTVGFAMEVLPIVNSQITVRTSTTIGENVAINLVAGVQQRIFITATRDVSGTCTFYDSSGQLGDTFYVKFPSVMQSAYPMLYAPPGTLVTSTAATSGGGGGAIPLNAAMTAALSGGAFTAAALCWMGVGSGELPTGLAVPIISANNSASGGLYAQDVGGTKRIVGSYDGSVGNPTLTLAWPRGEIHLRVVRTNAARTHFRVEYRRCTSAMVPIDAVPVWGALTAYDGSMNPLTHLRFGYGLTVPIGFLQTQLWNKSASDVEILSVLKFAAEPETSTTDYLYLNDDRMTINDDPLTF